jgi:predicted transcriptional regulator
MPRPKEEKPTAGELEVLKVLWARGPSTVREVMDVLNERRPRAYTSVMSLLNVMTDKGLLVRVPQGRAFVYRARLDRRRTLGGMVEDLLGRAFDGSASQLVAHLLDKHQPSSEELAEIRRTIQQYARQQGNHP